MEIKAENYLINYYANSSDFRIIIYNNITTKKYETIKTSDDYKMYKDIGLDIFEIIKNCLDNNTFTINDSNDYLTLLLTYKESTKISINCDNLRIDKKEIELIGLKNDIHELKNIMHKQNTIIKNQNTILEKLKPYYEVETIDNIKINKKEAELVQLKKDTNGTVKLVREIITQVKYYNDTLTKLKPYYDYELVTIDNNTFHKDIQEIHVNKLTKTYNKDYWNYYTGTKIKIPCILLDNFSLERDNKPKTPNDIRKLLDEHQHSIPHKLCQPAINYILIDIYCVDTEYTNTTKEFICKKGWRLSHYSIIKTPQFRKYHKYPEIPKIYFSDTIKIKELTDNLQNLTLIGFSYFDITHDDIHNLLNLKKLTKVKFYKCNFINITQQKIIIMLGQIEAIFTLYPKSNL